MPLSDRFDQASEIESPPDFLERFPIGTLLRLEMSAFPMPFYVRIKGYSVDSERVIASVFSDFEENTSLDFYSKENYGRSLPRELNLIISTNNIGGLVVLTGQDYFRREPVLYPVASVSLHNSPLSIRDHFRMRTNSALGRSEEITVPASL
ncbi:MAG: hypothetical protein HHAS10_11140 [Candidatus Altimarinota bacterium]